MKRSRILPILLVCAMIFGMIPAAAFATGPEYTFAEIEYYSNMAKEYVPAGCYYTDSWFGEDPAERNDAKYAAIHNYVADDDPVAMLPPWGMVRYGQIHVYNTAPFEDVPSDAYYAKAVAWAVSQGITAGTDATHFSPDASCTRAQIVTFLYLALGQN